MGKEMEMVKVIIIMVNYALKANIYIIKNEKEKNIMKKEC